MPRPRQPNHHQDHDEAIAAFRRAMLSGLWARARSALPSACPAAQAFYIERIRALADRALIDPTPADYARFEPCDAAKIGILRGLMNRGLGLVPANLFEAAILGIELAEGRRPSWPSPFCPGTPAKLDHMAARLAAGEDLHGPDDYDPRKGN